MRRSFVLPSLAVPTLFVLAACGGAPTDAGSARGPVTTFTVDAAATAAAASATGRFVRTFPTIDKRGGPSQDRVSESAHIDSPFDLTYFGGALMKSGTSHNVYVNCPEGPAACWGEAAATPATFLDDLATTPMIHVVDQYLGTLHNGPVPIITGVGPFGTDELATTMAFAGGNIATMNEILSIVYAAYLQTRGSGYTHIFHVFLREGTDMCEQPGVCYSPDNFSTFYFCAFHGSVNFVGGAHVLFSVEPFQAVPGCQMPAQSQLSATASTLSHEFFETITDPDGDGWWNFLTGEEVADLCQLFQNAEHLNGNAYVIQSEYSNARHACTDVP